MLVRFRLPYIVWCGIVGGSLIMTVFFASRRRHTRCALVTRVQTCALPICRRGTERASAAPDQGVFHRLGLAVRPQHLLLPGRLLPSGGIPEMVADPAVHEIGRAHV